MSACQPAVSRSPHGDPSRHPFASSRRVGRTAKGLVTKEEAVELSTSATSDVPAAADATTTAATATRDST